MSLHLTEFQKYRAGKNLPINFMRIHMVFGAFVIFQLTKAFVD